MHFLSSQPSSFSSSMAGVLVSVLRGVGLYVVAGSAQSQFDTYCVRWMRRVHVVIKWGVFRLTRARALAWGPLLPLSLHKVGSP